MSLRRASSVFLILGLIAATIGAVPAGAAPEAPPIKLVKDLATERGLDDSSGARDYVQLGSSMLFAAADGVVGEELWKTDGTPGGTSLVKDLNPGSGDSYPGAFTVVGGDAFFFTATVVNEEDVYGLWVTDGTTAGTVQLLSDAGELEEAVAYAGEYYFFIRTTGGDSQLWKSDGTQLGTVMVEDFEQGIGSVNAVAFGSQIIFSANIGSYGYELWSTDGTVGGAALFKDLVDGTSSNPSNFTVVGTDLYFRAAYEATQSQYVLWKSEGTPETTAVVEDPTAGGPGTADLLTAVGDVLYFLGADETNGQELWTSDGTPEGTELVEDLTSGDAQSFIYEMVALDGVAYFLMFDDTGATHLGKSGGEAANTELMVEVGPSGGPSAGRLTAGDGKLFFVGSDGTHGSEVWSSDGTSVGTDMLVDLDPIDTFQSPTFLTVGPSGHLFFTASSPAGREPYVSTGAAGNATLLKDIKVPSSSFSPDQRWVATGGKVFFPFDDGVHGSELWMTDGTDAGTQMIEDIYPGPLGSGISEMDVMNGIVYFTASTPTLGAELWRSDGTEFGTRNLEDIDPLADNGGAYELTPVGNTLYFVASDGSDQEIWKTDGSIGGAVPVTDFGSGFPQFLTRIGSELWFHQYQGSAQGLYKTTGTGSTLLKANMYTAEGFLSFGGSVYFVGEDDSLARELWKSNGTPAGTVQVTHHGGLNPRSLTPLGSAFYFFGNENGDSNKHRLFRSTGTEASTLPISSLSVTSLSHLRAVGPRLVFAADDGVNGRELWRSDGTAAGTVMVKNIGPGDGLDEQPWFTVAGKALYFAAEDATHQTELWVSDGTGGNTFMVQDFNTIGSTDPSHLTVSGNKIFLSGVTETVGRELLGLTAPRPTTLTLKVSKTRRKVKAAGLLNPTHTGAPVSVTLYKRKNGRFRKVATKKPASNSAGAYATSFRRQSVRRCKMTARYAGHVDHLPSSRSVTFRC